MLKRLFGASALPVVAARNIGLTAAGLLSPVRAAFARAAVAEQLDVSRIGTFSAAAARQAGTEATPIN